MRERRYPIGIQTFSEIRKGGYIYIDKTAKEALEQIDTKGYAIPYQTDGRKVVKAGINFSSETKTLTDWEIV